MANHLVTSETARQVQKAGAGGGGFLPPVPVEAIMHQLTLALGRYVFDPSRTIGIQKVCRLFHHLHEWSKDNLIAAGMTFTIRFIVDQTNERFWWEYNAVSHQMPVFFNILTSSEMPREINQEDLVYYVLEGLETASENTNNFNAIINRGIKPKIPEFNTSMLLSWIMDQYDVKDDWVGVKSRDISSLLSQAKGFEVSPGFYLGFDVFELEHQGWAQLRMIIHVRGAGIRFIVSEGEIGLNNKIKRADVSSVIGGLLSQAVVGIRHWNWLIDGGHKQQLNFSQPKPKKMSPW